MEIVFDILEMILDLYIAFFDYTMPDKELSKGKRIALRVLCVAVIILIIASASVGIFLMIEGQRVGTIVGIVLLAFAVVAIMAHIILALHNSKKKKEITPPLDKDDMDEIYKK